MRISVLVLAIFALSFAGPATTDAEPGPREYLKRYTGKTKLPDDLYETYAALAKAMKGADRKAIEAHLLPGSVTISTGRRPAAKMEYGAYLNLPFAKERFGTQILGVRKEQSDVYLIRTGSSYLRFVSTHSGKWRLYHYGDKPIQ